MATQAQAFTMLHRTGSTHITLGGTPRHRGRASPAPWPTSDHPHAPSGKRPRINSRLFLLVVALALASVYSLAIFHAGKQAAHHAEADGTAHIASSSTLQPGKRHRKLERPGETSDGQAAAALAADQAGDAVAAVQEPQEQEQQQQKEQQQQGAAGVADQQLQQTQAQEQPQAAQEQHAAQQTAEQAQQTAEQAQQAAQQEQEEQQAHAAATAAADAENAAAQAAQTAVEEESSTRQRSPYWDAVSQCTTLACLKEAALTKERHKGQYLFPHFLIIGWQKCATTSLFHHLKDHPSVLTPSEKEPEFFSYDCNYDPLGCPADKQKEYIEQTLHRDRALKHNLFRIAFEGSTHYAREGPKMARGLREVFPWVKLIASMREPISRYLSMLGHNLDHDTYTCLKKQPDLFSCLELELPWNNYTTPFAAYLEAFPKEQLLLLQYESLIAPEYEAEHLRAVKNFIGVNPELPKSAALPHSNTRAARLGQEPEGWKMLRWQYERLIEVVRPDAESIANIVSQHGLGDGAVWMANWEAAWKANLDSCDADGNCIVH